MASRFSSRTKKKLLATPLIVFFLIVGIAVAVVGVQTSNENRSQASEDWICQSQSDPDMTCIRNAGCKAEGGWACKERKEVKAIKELDPKNPNWCGAAAKEGKFGGVCQGEGQTMCGGDGVETECTGGRWKITGACCTGYGGEGGRPTSCGKNQSAASCTGQCSWITCGDGSGVCSFKNQDVEKVCKKTSNASSKNFDGKLPPATLIDVSSQTVQAQRFQPIAPGQCPAGSSWYSCDKSCWTTGIPATAICGCSQGNRGNCISPCSWDEKNQECSNTNTDKSCNPDTSGKRYAGSCFGDNNNTCGDDGKEVSCNGNKWEATGLCCSPKGQYKSTIITEPISSTKDSCNNLQSDKCNGDCVWASWGTPHCVRAIKESVPDFSKKICKSGLDCVSFSKDAPKKSEMCYSQYKSSIIKAWCCSAGKTIQDGVCKKK